MRRSGESVTTPVGMVSMMVSSSTRRRCRAALTSVSCAEDASAAARACSRSDGHAVEAVDKFAEFFCGRLLHPARVVAVGNGLHGVGERFHRAGDLLGGVEREPAAGEQGEQGGERQEAGVEGAHLPAFAEDDPVGSGRVVQTHGGGRDLLRERETDDNEAAVGQARRGQAVVGVAELEQFAVCSPGGLENVSPKGGGGHFEGRSRRNRFGRRVGQMVGQQGVVFAVQDDKAALQGEVMRPQRSLNGREVGVALVPGMAAVKGRRPGEFHGESFGFRAGVVVGVALQRGQHAFGVVAHFGDGLREPAVYGAVHQQIAEGEHEGERHQRDKDGSPEHAGAQAGCRGLRLRWSL